jgi:hypothetical protein
MMMATMKKGILTSAHEWWVHLRPFGKRRFWKRERKAARDEFRAYRKERRGSDCTWIVPGTGERHQ